VPSRGINTLPTPSVEKGGVILQEEKKKAANKEKEIAYHKNEDTAFC